MSGPFTGLEEGRPPLAERRARIGPVNRRRRKKHGIVRRPIGPNTLDHAKRPDAHRRHGQGDQRRRAPIQARMSVSRDHHNGPAMRLKSRQRGGRDPGIPQPLGLDETGQNRLRQRIAMGGKLQRFARGLLLRRQRHIQTEQRGLRPKGDRRTGLERALRLCARYFRAINRQLRGISQQRRIKLKTLASRSSPNPAQLPAPQDLWPKQV